MWWRIFIDSGGIPPEAQPSLTMKRWEGIILTFLSVAVIAGGYLFPHCTLQVEEGKVLLSAKEAFQRILAETGVPVSAIFASFATVSVVLSIVAKSVASWRMVFLARFSVYKQLTSTAKRAFSSLVVLTDAVCVSSLTIGSL